MTEVHHSSSDAAADSRPAGGDDIAARVASRICHDLVSPLGAIANGIELLLLAGAARTPETDLIVESVESANARIRFFRLAFGGSGGQPVSRSEIVATLRGIERGSRLSYDWTGAGDHPRAEVKAVFLLLMCVEAALPLGGVVRISRDPVGWEVVGRGPRLRLDAELWGALERGLPIVPASGGQVAFGLLPDLLAALGRRVEMVQDADTLRLRF